MAEIWGTVATIGGSLLAGYLGNKENKKSGPQQGSNSPAYYDPYAPYRPNAAAQLQSLMQDPSQVQTTPEYAAMLEAAGRTSAAQGYNGSGNALVAAANAGGQAYQQAFNNLAMLSGANQSPAQASMLAANQGNYNQNMNNNMWGGLGTIFGRLGPAVGNMFGGGGGGGGGGGMNFNDGTWAEI